MGDLKLQINTICYIKNLFEIKLIGIVFETIIQK